MGLFCYGCHAKETSRSKSTNQFHAVCEACMLLSPQHEGIVVASLLGYWGDINMFNLYTYKCIMDMSRD